VIATAKTPSLNAAVRSGVMAVYFAAAAEVPARFPWY